jgi:dGTPase
MMDLKKLLNDRRVREIMNSGPSTRGARDSRTEFQRDYGRILYSTPVRRLSDKAQVFPLEPNDSVRTRLTHSLEVSSVARDLAAQAARWLPGVRDHEMSDIASIASTCGLVHDLGNPPFGHAGELAIQTWFQQQPESFFAPLGGRESQFAQDFLRFEGNAQTLRLLTKLQVLADDLSLNLTAGTLSAALKYTAPSTFPHTAESPHECSKPGYFASEAEIVEMIRRETGTGEARNPIAFLVEAADDIVYSTVDLEDSVKKGVLTWDQIHEHVRAAAIGASKEQRAICDNALERAAREIHRELRGKAKEQALAQAFRTAAIGEMVPSAVETFDAQHKLILNGDYHKELLEDEACSAQTLVKACKSLLRGFTYCDEGILRLEIMGRTVIHDLMDLLWQAAPGFRPDPDPQTYEGKTYLLISENYRRVFEESLQQDSGRPPEVYRKLQLITDHVCGMTDTYACSLHRRLMNA